MFLNIQLILVNNYKHGDQVKYIEYIKLPVDEVNPECEISVVDVEAIGAFVHCAITPVGSLQILS